ncbi:MAG: signal peptidase I [Clostridia bacterium]
MDKIKTIIKEISIYLIITVVVAIIVKYIVAIDVVFDKKMEPSLNKNDVVVINKLIYKSFEVKKYEVVVIKNKDSRYLIKRVIGMPLEKIKTRNFRNQEENVCVIDEFIPLSKYLVIGDNKEDDQATLINKEDIVGRVILKIWPLF